VGFRKYYTRVEVTDGDKHSSLLKFRMDMAIKSFGRIGFCKYLTRVEVCDNNKQSTLI